MVHKLVTGHVSSYNSSFRSFDRLHHFTLVIIPFGRSGPIPTLTSVIEKGNLVKNLPFEPHTLGTLDHPVMFLDNGVSINSRNRKKEAAVTAVPPPPTNFFSLQHQRPPQTLVSTALGLDLNDKRPPPPKPSPPPPQKMCMPLLSFTSLLTEDRYADIVEQSDQIDEIIETHADQLRRKLADKWQRHYSTLLCAAEERASKRLKERELEFENTVRRNTQLEQRAAHFCAEAQVWKAKAKKLEETATSLRAALRLATTREGCGEEGSRPECAGCGVAEDAESSYVDPERVEPVILACKACEKRVASVMMWPCRHVCVCRRCDAVTKACPVCLSLKTTSVEVFLP